MTSSRDSLNTANQDMVHVLRCDLAQQTKPQAGLVDCREAQVLQVSNILLSVAVLQYWVSLLGTLL